jgi:cytochrome c oxidase cbb3-type subunit III
LRTAVIVGRPDLGMPDWREQKDDPMTAQEISDVVAFLVAQKPSSAGPAQTAPAQGAAQPPSTLSSRKAGGAR